ncbi:MAG: inositol monophosphatase [Magnetococcales bacterium]|nr:inositol monophosphatase [Magnetococcales bacterium]
MNLSPQMHIAVRTARSVSKRLTDRFENRHELSPNKKGHNDLVSDADVETEEEIIRQLKGSYPSYKVLAEESGGSLPKRGFCWIIDPIDGTTNFIHGIPHFSISIALAENGKVIGGLVFDPMRNEMFVGENGRGAFLNDYRIRTSKSQSLKDSLIATGFPHREKADLESYLKTFSSIFKECRGIRRQGSAALDLAYVAAGRYDGFWESGLSRWDIAAGAIIVSEAGGFITDFKGGSGFLNSGEVVAATPAVHTQMMEKISTKEKREKKITLKLKKD